MVNLPTAMDGNTRPILKPSTDIVVSINAGTRVGEDVGQELE
jgi:hypothetical protein